MFCFPGRRPQSSDELFSRDYGFIHSLFTCGFPFWLRCPLDEYETRVPQVNGLLLTQIEVQVGKSLIVRRHRGRSNWTDDQSRILNSCQALMSWRVSILKDNGMFQSNCIVCIKRPEGELYIYCACYYSASQHQPQPEVLNVNYDVNVC